MTRSRPTRPLAALAVAAALATAACLPAARHFHALAAGWMAEIDDLTGSILEVHAARAPSAVDAAWLAQGPWAADASLPAPDAIAIWNLSPDTIEIGWRGQPTTETPGWFRFTTTDAGLLVRYEVVPALSDAGGATYAFEVRFDHPVAASSVTARPADWP